MADNERPTPARRGLADILDDTPVTPPERIPAEVVRAVAASSGLGERSGGRATPPAAPPPAAAPAPEADEADVAFVKPRSDRKHTINVRVNREARAFVAQEAMRRGVAIAEVIEDAIAALRASREAH